MGLHVRNNLAGIGLIPAAIEILCDRTKLYEKVAGQIFRLGLAALFAPKPQQGGLIVAHDDPGVGSSDERAPRSTGFAFSSMPFSNIVIVVSMIKEIDTQVKRKTLKLIKCLPGSQGHAHGIAM